MHYHLAKTAPLVNRTYCYECDGDAEYESHKWPPPKPSPPRTATVHPLSLAEVGACVFVPVAVNVTISDEPHKAQDAANERQDECRPQERAA